LGTQQILMIILSVIVVGTAIAAGIQMFDRQYENQTKLMMAQEVTRLAQMCKAWYRTPVAMGGFGNGRNPMTGQLEPFTNAYVDQLAKYLDNSAARQYSGTYPRWTNQIGTFQLTRSNSSLSTSVTINCTSVANTDWTVYIEVDIASNDALDYVHGIVNS